MNIRIGFVVKTTFGKEYRCDRIEVDNRENCQNVMLEMQEENRTVRMHADNIESIEVASYHITKIKGKEKYEVQDAPETPE